MVIAVPSIPKTLIPIENPRVLQEVRSFIDELLLYNDAHEAYRAYQYFTFVLSQKSDFRLSHADLAQQYGELMVEIQYIALPMMSEQVIAEFLKTHAVFGLTHSSIPLLDKIEAKLITMFVLETRDPFKAKVRATLEANQEVLTVASLQGPGKTIQGTVGNWLQDYRKAAGGGKVSTLVRTQYLVNSLNTKSLSDKDRAHLTTLIELYEYLKRSTFDIDGMEESHVLADERGKLWTLREGQFEPAIDKETEVFVEELRQKGLFAYPELSFEEAIDRFWKDQEDLANVVKAAYASPVDPDVAQEVPKLRKAKKSTAELGALAFESTVPGPGKLVKKTVALACLEMLAELGALTSLIEAKGAFRAWFENRLKVEARPKEIEGFNITPGAPNYMSKFLRAVLQGELKIEESLAAKEVALLGNLMRGAGKSEYTDLAYFDAAKKQFVWKG